MMRPMQSLLKRLVKIRSKPLVAKRLGANWLLYPRDWIDNRIYIGRPYEQKQLEFAQDCIQEYDLETFYDCGANVGFYSVLLGLRAKKLLRIHAFEPVPNTWGRLVTNVMLNNLNHIITAHNFGLGDKSGELQIAYSANSTGTSTLLEGDAEGRNFEEHIHVQISVFDDVFKIKNEESFLKLDVEGFELPALNGMKKYLKNNFCILQVELWENNRSKTIEYLKTLDYKLFNQIGSDYYFQK